MPILTIKAIEIKPQGAGKIAEVTYDQGGKFAKTDQKKRVASWGVSESVFTFLATNKDKLPFNADVVNTQEGQYWNWTAIKFAGGEGGGNSGSPAAPASGGAFVPANDDKRQLLIVRQSSLDRAIQYFELTKSTKVTEGEVVALAERFKDYVFDGLGNAAATAFGSFDEDVPL